MKELICIVCPKGCHLQVFKETVQGNGCKRGKEYGIREAMAPTRMVTSTVAVRGGTLSRLPVKTAAPIPKGQVMELMELIHSLEVSAPIQLGAVIAPNVLGSGVDLIACKNIDVVKGDTDE